MTLSERAGELGRRKNELEQALRSIARGATLRAVEEAVRRTPPTENDLRGTNTRTGELKQHWVTDSDTSPTRRGDELVTTLANDMEYASYVNDGHRMDRHFVPGLNINTESGMLEYDPDGKGGIVVGTRTSYVPGLHMTDRARKVYRETVEKECVKLEEVFR